MSTLRDRFFQEQQDKEAFAKLRKQCEPKVVRWKFWDTPEWHWDPEEVVGGPKPAPKDKAYYHYGYDKNGRVVMVRYALYWQKDAKPQFFFLRWRHNMVSVSNFGWGSLICVFDSEEDDGRVIRALRYGGGTVADDWDSRIAEWKDGKVLKITTARRCIGGTERIAKTYDKKGELVEEVDCSKIKKEEPLPNGITLKSLSEEIRSRMIQTVVKTVTALKPKKPAYCLALNYDCEGNPVMPPMLGIGLDSERQARLKKGGKDAKLDIWEPEQMSLFAKEKTDKVIFNDKKLQKACGYYNRLLDKKGDNTPAHKLLNEIAAELGRMDWAGKLNTTDDFIAYAVDTDLADLQKNLKQSVPADRLKKLKAAKML